MSHGISDGPIGNNSRELRTNKPRTAKVGAIPKAQNCKRGDPSGFVKLQLVAKYEQNLRGALWGLEKIFQKKNYNEIFEQCHSAEKCKSP